MNFGAILLVVVIVVGVSLGGSPPDGARSDVCPCATVRCPAGTQCVLQEVQCFAAPCNPQPFCQPIQPDPSCATVRCSAGHICVLQQVQCIRAPCPPIPACVVDNNGGYLAK